MSPSAPSGGAARAANDDRRPEVTIVGAGIIGLALGVRLALDGRRVTLVDAGEPAGGASYGNAGYISEGSIFPPASADVLRRLPRLLVDRAGPLVIRAGHLHRMVPWGLRLVAAARPTAAARTVDALTALNRLAIPSYAPLLRASDAESLVVARGSLMVCRSAATLAGKAEGMRVVRSKGIAVEQVDAAEVRRLEPAVRADVAGGIFYPDNAHCVDPGRLGRRFADFVLANGGRLVRGAVKALRPARDGGWTVVTDGGDHHADKLVVAAGFGSAALMRPLGHKVPLAAERGYHLMLPSPGVMLARPTIMAERYFAATPMDGGIRLAGTAEFARADAPMDPRRSDILLGLAKEYLPDLDGTGATRWMGVRPSFPDALPAIGASTRHRDLFYSFGHHHVGLTQAAVSAQVLADVIDERTPPVDVAPLAIERFG